MDQEELDYREFLSTLWSDPPIDTTTGASLNEEEEEEEDYQQAEDEEEDEEDDEEGDEDDEDKLRHTEVRDLVSDCLKTVVSNSAHRALNPSSSSPSSSSSSTVDSSPASTHLHRHANLTNYVKSIFNKSKNGITSEICIEGMPVNTIRSIIARQMSMCVQLLLQLLLLTSNNSSSFSSSSSSSSLNPSLEIENACYNHMMKINNLRESILRKSMVLCMTVQNISKYNDQQQKKKKSSASSCDSVVPNAPIVLEEKKKVEDYLRITRSYRTEERCYSIFDIPFLAKGIEVFFSQVDTLRGPSFQPNSISATSTTSSLDSHSKFELLHIKMKELYSKLQMPLWKCLLPSSSYPLPPSTLSLINPGSLMGRRQFTPAEDDLLLRGIIAFGEEDEWARIQDEYLPSKDA